MVTKPPGYRSMIDSCDKSAVTETRSVWEGRKSEKEMSVRPRIVSLHGAAAGTAMTHFILKPRQKRTGMNKVALYLACKYRPGGYMADEEGLHRLTVMESTPSRWGAERLVLK